MGIRINTDTDNQSDEKPKSTIYAEERLHRWLAECPGFQQLWDDLLECCEVPFNPVTLEDGKDTASVYGMCLLDIGPDRLVLHARRAARWQPGNIRSLLERSQLRTLIDKADEARMQRKAEHYSAAKKRENKRHIPDTFRQKWSKA